MKHMLLIITALILIVGCSKPVDETTLIDKDGLMYLPDSDKPYTGEVIGSYPSGEKFYSGNYENGRLEGEYIFYNKDGTVKEPIIEDNLVDKYDIKYKSGSDEPFWGKVISVYMSGEKLFDGVYENGVLVGEYNYYKKDGSVKEPINADEMLTERDGVWYTKDTNKPYSGPVFILFKNGQKFSEGTLKYGEPEGKWTMWYENGQKRTERTLKGVDDDGEPIVDGKTTVWYENGQKKKEVTYKDGIGDGLWTLWYENGQKKAEGTYWDGEEEGKWITWYENGQKMTEGTFKDGEEDGKWTEWYENGQKEKEGTYKNGEKEGQWTEWYENGQKKKEGMHKDGHSTGVWTNWYENGQKYSEVTLKYGFIDGKLIRWYENGQREIIGTYKDGELVDETRWDEDGNLIDK